MTRMSIENVARRPLAAPLVIGLVVVVAIAAMYMPRLREALDIWRRKRTMGDMRAIAMGLESYRIDHGDTYPVTRVPAPHAVGDLVPLLVPTYVKRLPRLDGWGRPFQVVSSAKEYTITSYGSDGKPDLPDGPSSLPNGLTTSFAGDLVFSAGAFVKYPDGHWTL